MIDIKQLGPGVSLGGVACGRCGHAGLLFYPKFGVTSHVNGRIEPCRTSRVPAVLALDTPQKPVEVSL